MRIFDEVDQFRVACGQSFRLADFPTTVAPLYADKKDYNRQLKTLRKQIDEYQQMMYANDHHSLLLVFQAMDAAGKDGTIRNILSGVNPLGVAVHSFKQPSTREIDHDFLWRTMECLPRRGNISVFNRSYYEEVLVVKVHPEILKNHQRVPKQHHQNVWEGRYSSIRQHEEHLTRNGTRVLKFFLNVSKDEQLARFVSRIDEPEKNWKFSEADIEERKHWDDYQLAYEEAIRETSSQDAPWYVIPADDKRNLRLLVAQAIADEMRLLDLSYPVVTDARRAELSEIRVSLVGEPTPLDCRVSD